MMSFWGNVYKGAKKTACNAIAFSFGIVLGGNGAFLSMSNKIPREWAVGYNEACRDWNMTAKGCYGSVSVDDARFVFSMLGLLTIDVVAIVGFSGASSIVGGLFYAAYKAYFGKNKSGLNIQIERKNNEEGDALLGEEKEEREEREERMTNKV